MFVKYLRSGSSGSIVLRDQDRIGRLSLFRSEMAHKCDIITTTLLPLLQLRSSCIPATLLPLINLKCSIVHVGIGYQWAKI